MIDKGRRAEKELNKQKTRQRMHVQIDLDNYEYFPAEKEPDFYSTEITQYVGIYVRVSTGDVKQTTSFELQKKYYEDYVSKHSNWHLVKIYADEGISGTSLKNRVAFAEMIKDSQDGKLTLIITKSVSRFARNTEDHLSVLRKLSHLKKPVGVFFESECIFSLNDDSQMALSFLATMAQEESHTRSRSMETSLRMRLDNGIPLTPKLLGYTHDSDGNLIINQDEAPTVKLAFFMYLYGYSTKQIAETFNAIGKKSYLGNINWTANGIVQILRNERHCGNVLTRKTWTPDFKDHKSKKNYGKRPQSLYKKHHDPIVSHEDFNAVQRLLDNAKYGNKGFLPELKVISDGLLKGFVTVYPKWAAFKANDYYQAAVSISHLGNADEKSVEKDITVTVDAGDFDLRNFEVTRGEFFDIAKQPLIAFYNSKIRLGSELIKRLGGNNYIEMLINPLTMQFAIRTTQKTNRQGVYCSKLCSKKYEPRCIAATAFFNTVFELFSWNTDYKYQIIGNLYETESGTACIFDANSSEIYLKSHMIPSDAPIQKPLSKSGSRICAVPKAWTNSFGRSYYYHELSYAALAKQSKEEWQIRVEGQLVEYGNNRNITPYEIIKKYIDEQLQGIIVSGANND